MTLVVDYKYVWGGGEGQTYPMLRENNVAEAYIEAIPGSWFGGKIHECMNVINAAYRE